VRIQNVLASVLFLASAGAALADYDATKWGMTQEQVKSLFPDGISVEGRDITRAGVRQITVYRIWREIATFPSIVEFQFDGGLSKVTVTPKTRRMTMDKHNLEFSDWPFGSGEGKDVTRRLRSLLTKKYRKPSESLLKCDTSPWICSVEWESKTDDITLSWSMLDNEIHYVVVSYEPLAALRDTKRL
jgi:hypothetical protein